MQVLITAALKSGSLGSEDVGFLALHGTGTPLGDPIEIGAIGQTLGGTIVSRNLPVALSSVKVNQDPVQINLNLSSRKASAIQLVYQQTCNSGALLNYAIHC